MATIRTTQAHDLPKAEARARVEALAQTYREKLGVSYRWRGDTLRFERAGTSGAIAVEERLVRVEMTLGWMLRPMRAEVERMLREHLAEHFE